MKHLGGVLAVLTAALVTFLLYKGLDWIYIIILALLAYAVIFTLEHKKKKAKKAAAEEEFKKLIP